jgi:hypothetical protein
MTRAELLFFESQSRSTLLVKHDLFRKPVSTSGSCSNLLSSGSLRQMASGIGVSRAFCQDRLRLCRRLCAITAFRRDDGQIPPRDMAVNPLIDAAKLTGPPQSQDVPPANFCCVP